MIESSFKKILFPFVAKFACAAVLSGVGLLTLTAPAGAANPLGICLDGQMEAFIPTGATNPSRDHRLYRQPDRGEYTDYLIGR